MQREAFVTARGQFGRPRGVLGWIAGRLMAHGNEAMNRAAFELLNERNGRRIDNRRALRFLGRQR